MAKKDRPDDATPLRHNPFAALLGGSTTQVVPEATQKAEPKREPAPEPKREPRPAPSPEKAAPGTGGKSRGRLVLRRETKHRGGKAVIVVTGFAAVRDFDEAAVEALAKTLKQTLGCGGTVEHEGGLHIVLQGDRAAKVAELLRSQGFRVDGVTS